ncbi:hypothetical protein EMCRGX_G015807 [Ephydatia muelleri]
MEAHERKKQRDKKRYANDPESKKSYEKARPLENRIIREEDERKKQSDKKGYVNDNKKINPWRHSLFEPSASVQAPDGFDAVSVQNVGSTYIIVSWDLPTDSNGILINFSLYCNGALAGVLPLTVISYDTTGLLPFTLYMYITLSVGQVLQSRPQALHSSWNVVLGVISAAASLPSGAYCPQTFMTPTSTVVYVGLGGLTATT